MSDEFWDEMSGVYGTRMADLDQYLNEDKVVRRLFQASEMPLEAVAGTRVLFDSQLSTLLAYTDPPDFRVAGTVVTVRTAMGNLTEHAGLVFVKWDDGRFMGVHKAHLRLAPTADRKAASSHRRVVASLGDLDDFLRVASSGPDLVHKATRDLWSLKVTGGEYVIERLFDETGESLKV